MGHAIIQTRPPRPTVTLLRVLRKLGPGGLIGAALSAAVLLAALLAPVVSPYDPLEPDFLSMLATPSPAHPFGTDAVGRDVFSRILQGARPSILVGLGTALFAAFFGTAIGLFAGFLGGRWDNTIMRVMDILFAFPAILLALALISVLGPSLVNVIIALGIVYIPRFARVVRGLLPNTTSVIVVQATLTIATAILSEASLSCLGLGVQPPDPSWGTMLSEGKTYMEQYPHLMIFPGAAIMAAVLGFNLLGDALRDLLER
jgi:peptide/nickel transport system permease protein